MLNLTQALRIHLLIFIWNNYLFVTQRLSLTVISLLQQSVIGKRFDHLYKYVCRDYCYDVVALTETHLSQDIDDNENQHWKLHTF